MISERSFRLFGTSDEAEVTFSAENRWDALSQAERILDSSDFFASFTEVWLSDEEQNCLICLFDRENSQDVWNCRPR